jgi:hypothetical protein
MSPSPGTATLDDLIAANESKTGPVCEWVEGTLVEKAMGFHESTVAMIVGFEIELDLRSNGVGMITGPDGVMKILPRIGRAPVVAFLAWASLPGGKPPPRSDKVPAVTDGTSNTIMAGERDGLNQVAGIWAVRETKGGSVGVISVLGRPNWPINTRYAGGTACCGADSGCTRYTWSLHPGVRTSCSATPPSTSCGTGSRPTRPSRTAPSR